MTLGTYINVNDEIINRTLYYNPECDVFISHIGDPFNQIYLDMVKGFFNDNCPPIRSAAIELSISITGNMKYQLDNQTNGYISDN
jgi:hypothetical protein